MYQDNQIINISNSKDVNTVAFTCAKPPIFGYKLSNNVLDDPPSQMTRPVCLSMRALSAMMAASVRPRGLMLEAGCCGLIFCKFISRFNKYDK